MSQINKEHLEFMDECRQVFNDQILRETNINAEGDLIGLRYGADRDCIRMLELGQEIGFFAQMIPAYDERKFLNAHAKFHDYEMLDVRDELGQFVGEMEKQLKANDYKSHWSECSRKYLTEKLTNNLSKLETCVSHSEYRRRLVNIANLSMMLSDNDRRDELEPTFSERSVKYVEKLYGNCGDSLDTTRD